MEEETEEQIDPRWNELKKIDVYKRQELTGARTSGGTCGLIR